MKDVFEFEDTSRIIEVLNFIHRNKVKKFIDKELYDNLMNELKSRQPKMALLYNYKDNFDGGCN